MYHGVVHFIIGTLLQTNKANGPINFIHRLCYMYAPLKRRSSIFNASRDAKPKNLSNCCSYNPLFRFQSFDPITFLFLSYYSLRSCLLHMYVIYFRLRFFSRQPFLQFGVLYHRNTFIQHSSSLRKRQLHLRWSNSCTAYCSYLNHSFCQKLQCTFFKIFKEFYGNGQPKLVVTSHMQISGIHSSCLLSYVACNMTKFFNRYYYFIFFDPWCRVLFNQDWAAVATLYLLHSFDHHNISLSKRFSYTTA